MYIRYMVQEATYSTTIMRYMYISAYCVQEKKQNCYIEVVVMIMEKKDRNKKVVTS